jgi:hypothetical protein
MASDGKWYPPQDVVDIGRPTPPPGFVPQPTHPAPVPAQPFLLTIGDIGLTADTIVTPNGTGTLAGSQWIVTDRSYTTSKIPSWAIVMAVIFALACLLGLLFLLVKEEVTTGYVDVSVHTGNLTHLTQLPVASPHDVMHYRQLVGQAQSLAAQAGGR